MRSLLWVALIAIPSIAACNYTVGDCYPRGQGEGNAGVGGGGVILPSGAGGLGDAPPEPGGASGSLACNASEESPPDDGGSQEGDGTELDTYIRCRGMDAMTCEAMCFDIGATCAGLKTHPYGSKGGIGRLKLCKNGFPTTTCTYCYDNGDVCAFVKTLGVPFVVGCGYTGGKGCE